MKTYGKLHYDVKKEAWVIAAVEPHVSIRLKSLFPKVSKVSLPPYFLPNTAEMSADIKWFLERYPLIMSKGDKQRLGRFSNQYFQQQAEVERLLLPDYVPSAILGVRKGEALRSHQLVAIDMGYLVKRMLLVDAIGTGKTYTGIGSALKTQNLPAAFVVQAHLAHQFKEKTEEFSHLKAHVIKTRKPYDLPKADIYIFKYSILSGWVDIFAQHFFKFALFDEIQELRHGTSTNKGAAAKVLSDHVERVLGTTATPMYGYGIEMYQVMDIIKQGALGSRYEFVREWCKGNEKMVADPAALGSFLRESQLMLRRTKKDIYGVESQPNIIVEKVDYDEKAVQSAEDLAKQLAITTLTGSFTEQGAAAQQLDIRLRMLTGVSKAKNVAMFVRLLVESGEKVLLSGWHRDVYDIWQKELRDLGVAMYTGSETTATQKKKNFDAFAKGDAKVLILSHKSGAGLDGLQHVCSTVVIGELAWSKKLHEQIIGRVDRDGQKDPVSAFIMTSDFGSDPVMLSLLGLKHSQQVGILDPKKKISKVENSRSRLKTLATQYLESLSVDTKKLIAEASAKTLAD
jgi:superfamily II DNA or RNA helicase